MANDTTYSEPAHTEPTQGFTCSPTVGQWSTTWFVRKGTQDLWPTGTRSGVAKGQHHFQWTETREIGTIFEDSYYGDG